MSWKNEDWSTLTTLRPGAPFAEFSAPLKGKFTVEWDEEFFEMLNDEDEQICSGTVGEDGIVDSYTLDDDRVDFGLVVPGMSFEELSTKIIGLFRDSSEEAREIKMSEDFDSYWAPHSPGLAWHFVRADDIVLRVSLVVSDDDVEPFDARFWDNNFKLVVIQALVTNGTIKLPKVEATENEDDEAYEAGFIARSDAMYEMEITQAQLDTIETLLLDGDNQIYTFIDPEFDGESNEFDVIGIEGIETLTNLKSLSITAMTEHLSLAPLANHPSFEELSLSFAIYKDFSALESVPNLKQVTGFFDGEIYEEDEEALTRLAERGVNIHSHD